MGRGFSRSGDGDENLVALTLLSPLHEQLLRYLHLPMSLYTALAYNAS